MRANFPVILDACVLLPMPLADTLLRLGAKRVYLPRWTDDIMAEVGRNLVLKFGKTAAQAEHRASQIREHFPEAWVQGYQDLIPAMKNQEKDRHVLAAAVRAGSELIVSYNSRDFPPPTLEPYGIAVVGPSTFLWDLYELEPEIVHETLCEQAKASGQPLELLLERLEKAAPTFIVKLRGELKDSTGE